MYLFNLLNNLVTKNITLSSQGTTLHLTPLPMYSSVVKEEHSEDHGLSLAVRQLLWTYTRSVGVSPVH